MASHIPSDDLSSTVMTFWHDAFMANNSGDHRRCIELALARCSEHLTSVGFDKTPLLQLFDADDLSADVLGEASASAFQDAQGVS
jgi:hypothetical protein